MPPHQRLNGKSQPEVDATTVANNYDDKFPDINTIRNAIPAHCFEPSAVRSLAYVVRDFAMCLSLGWAALTYIPQLEQPAARWAAWIVYGWLQGLICTGIWIIGHEGGHGAFSMNTKLNDTVGWFAHSFLMVPYFSWKFSHGRHHRFTGHMEKDMAFVPRTRDDHFRAKPSNLWLNPENFEDTPIVNVVKLIGHQLFGWQMYLFFNASAGKASLQRNEKSWLRVSHFEPTSAVFRPSEALYIALSDLGLLITGSVLYWGSTKVGWETICLLYVVPYVWVHHWLGT
jgi:fatty acid desaturase